MAIKENKIKILIVEDDPFLLGMYSTKFEMEGFDIVTAENGVAGYETAVSEKPDLILLDVLLPEKDGFDVLRDLKKNVATREIPTVMLTNLSQKDDFEQGLGLGARDYLVKAHHLPSEVVSKVKQILSVD